MTIVQYVLVSCRLGEGLYAFINSTRWFFRSRALMALFIYRRKTICSLDFVSSGHYVTGGHASSSIIPRWGKSNPLL